MKCQVLYLGEIILKEELNFNIRVEGAVVQMWKQKAGSIIKRGIGGSSEDIER